MSADLLSNFIGITLQATGNNNNAWGEILNGSALVPLERAIAGNIVRAVTGGTLDLSANPPPAAVTQVLDFVQMFQGALTANQIVILPNLSKFWLMDNQTTGNFQLLMQTPSGSFINVPQGTTKFVACDGIGNLLRLDRDQIGNFEHNSVVKPGTLQCSGQSLLRTDYPDLYADIGTIYGSADSLHFTLPLLTDTGRFLRSITGSVTSGTYQANQNLSHTHAGSTFSGTTSTESATHAHTGSGSTGTESAAHSHAFSTPTIAGPNNNNGGGGGSFAAVASSVAGSSTGTESAAHSHAYSFTTAANNATHTHTFSGTTSTTPASGSTEARPENLSVNITIRY